MSGGMQACGTMLKAHHLALDEIPVKIVTFRYVSCAEGVEETHEEVVDAAGEACGEKEREVEEGAVGVVHIEEAGPNARQ